MVHDLWCRDASEMYFDILREQVSQFKNSMVAFAHDDIRHQPDLVSLAGLQQLDQIAMRLRMGGDFMAAPHEFPDVVPRELAGIFPNPIRHDAERAAPSALLLLHGD